MTPHPTTAITQLAPGQATRRYLRALQDRRANSVDWSAAPATFKHYPTVGRIILPWTPPSVPAAADPQLAVLSTLLRHLLGLGTSWTHPTTTSGWPTGGPPIVTVRRPAPSGGGLYPIEAYLAIAAGPGRTAALHHYDAAHHCLDLLRGGDHRGALVDLLTAPPPAIPDLVLVLSAVFWRNGFKYGEFAYRLHCQEIGVLTAHALALAQVLDLAATVHLTFADHHAQALLGLDPTCEGILAILTFTRTHISHSDARPNRECYPSVAELIATPANAAADPPPRVTQLLPHLTALHTAAAHQANSTPEQTTTPPTSTPQPPETSEVRLPPARQVDLASGIPARASSPTGYLPIPVDAELLATVLAAAATGYPGDLPGTPQVPATASLYVLIQRATGIPSGAYRYHPHTHTLIPIGATDAIDVLVQGPLQPNTRHALPEAAAVLVPVGDPLAGINHIGDRWYRIQQIETGLIIHRATLAATTHGLTARIHSDGTNHITDTALDLYATPLHSLSFLLLGHQRPGPVLRNNDKHSFEESLKRIKGTPYT